jgi:hypothetical protein
VLVVVSKSGSCEPRIARPKAKGLAVPKIRDVPAAAMKEKLTPFPQEPNNPWTPERKDSNVPNTITTLEWNDTASKYWRNLDQSFTFNCPPGGTIHTIWGTDIYTHDSSICTAAVHSGLITARDGGQVIIQIEPRQEFYQGTFRNGIESRSYGKYDGSFSFFNPNSPLIPL